MNKSYKEFLITAEPLNAEILSSVLWELNIDGVSEEINCIKVFTHDNSISESTIRDALEHLKKNNLIRSYEVQENVLYEKNWNEEWEKSRDVIHISERIVIKPTFKEYSPIENEIVITLDPKMSFGTGDHQTTKICLMFIEKYLRPGMKVLDVGSGTAILAIATAKLGAENVIAFDVDEWCYENGIENTQLNYVADKVEVRKCELNDISENNFDLIVANIQRNILIELAQGIKTRIKQNGILIISGLLEMDRDPIYHEFSSVGFDEIDFLKMDEWIGIVFKSK